MHTDGVSGRRFRPGSGFGNDGHLTDPEVGSSMQRAAANGGACTSGHPARCGCWTSGRWQVSWLAGRHPCRPSRFPSGMRWHGFAAHSCGGSRRFGALPLLRSLLIPSLGTIVATNDSIKVLQNPSNPRLAPHSGVLAVSTSRQRSAEFCKITLSFTPKLRRAKGWQAIENEARHGAPKSRVGAFGSPVRSTPRLKLSRGR